MKWSRKHGEEGSRVSDQVLVSALPGAAVTWITFSLCDVPSSAGKLGPEGECCWGGCELCVGTGMKGTSLRGGELMGAPGPGYLWPVSRWRQGGLTGEPGIMRRIQLWLVGRETLEVRAASDVAKKDPVSHLSSSICQMGVRTAPALPPPQVGRGVETLVGRLNDPVREGCMSWLPGPQSLHL